MRCHAARIRQERGRAQHRLQYLSASGPDSAIPMPPVWRRPPGPETAAGTRCGQLPRAARCGGYGPCLSTPRTDHTPRPAAAGGINVGGHAQVPWPDLRRGRRRRPGTGSAATCNSGTSCSGRRLDLRPPPGVARRGPAVPSGTELRLAVPIVAVSRRSELATALILHGHAALRAAASRQADPPGRARRTRGPGGGGAGLVACPDAGADLFTLRTAELVLRPGREGRRSQSAASTSTEERTPAVHRLRLPRHEPRHDLPGLGHRPAEPRHPGRGAQAQPAVLPLRDRHPGRDDQPRDQA